MLISLTVSDPSPATKQTFEAKLTPQQTLSRTRELESHPLKNAFVLLDAGTHELAPV